MITTFKKWLEAKQQPEPAKTYPELPYPGEDWPAGQTHAMADYHSPGSKDLPPTPKYGMKMKKKMKAKK